MASGLPRNVADVTTDMRLGSVSSTALPVMVAALETKVESFTSSLPVRGEPTSIAPPACAALPLAPIPLPAKVVALMLNAPLPLAASSMAAPANALFALKSDRLMVALPGGTDR